MELIAFTNRVVQASDYPALETIAKSVVKDKQKFERLELTKEQLLEMFAVRAVPLEIGNVAKPSSPVQPL